MKDTIKKTILMAAKYTGLFHLTKLLYRNRIRILCYHGFSLKNEEEFVPGLFIKPDVFEARMRYLKDKGYNVISLEDAYRASISGNIQNNSVIITIDDGFYSTFALGLPVLKKYNFPSTLYLTSYYFNKDCPIFTLGVNYMFWNSDLSEFDLSELGIENLGIVRVGTEQCETARLKINETGQAFNDNQDRINLLTKLGKATGQDFSELNQSRILNLINEAELKECVRGNMYI